MPYNYENKNNRKPCILLLPPGDEASRPFVVGCRVFCAFYGGQYVDTIS